MEQRKSGIQFTAEHEKKIEKYRLENLLTRKKFFKLTKISSKTTIDYRKKTRHISFGSVQKLRDAGIDIG